MFGTGSVASYPSFFLPANSGHCSTTYFSAASRITQATETFFRFAIASSEAYVSLGIVTDVRVEEAPLFSWDTVNPFGGAPQYTTLVQQDLGES
jgi:hypothetical protein